jgi:hypothetical protein
VPPACILRVAPPFYLIRAGETDILDVGFQLVNEDASVECDPAIRRRTPVNWSVPTLPFFSKVVRGVNTFANAANCRMVGLVLLKDDHSVSTHYYHQQLVARLHSQGFASSFGITIWFLDESVASDIALHCGMTKGAN